MADTPHSSCGCDADACAAPVTWTAPRPASGDAQHDHAGHAHDHNHDQSAGVVRLGAALVLALIAEALHFVTGDSGVTIPLGLAVAGVAIWLAGAGTYASGIKALRRGRLGINGLMSVAVTGAFLIGRWPEAAMVMALYAIAEMIEVRAAGRARNAIRSLLALAPEQAEVLQSDGRWQTAAAEQIALQAIVRIKPGARVPLDGIITDGQSAVNQAPVTGESLPVERGVGDMVYAGTINGSGELQFRVTATASSTTLARIIHAVEQAQATRAPTQRLVDRFAVVYTPAVFVLALATAVLVPWLTGLSWLAAAYEALVLLVIACPCALVISTPVTVVSALAAAARRGILIKGGSHLENARSLKAMALDKTGTVTEGRPQLVEWTVLGPGADRNSIARIAMSLAERSDHPVSKAIAQGLACRTQPVDSFTALVGQGTQGAIGGHTYVLGHHPVLHERGLCNAGVEAALKVHEDQGRTVTLLANEHAVLAVFAVADTIKATSRPAVAELKALGVATVLLSGDNPATASAIAAQAGIPEAQGGLLPHDKLAQVQALQRRFGTIGMAGDGINDAPALARADIGFAMGGAGTDTAMEAADVVIMNDDLRRLPETIRLSRRTHAVLLQNIALALGIKAVFIVLALMGDATMWMAVFADVGATLLVVANGLRLLKTKTDDSAVAL